MKIINQYPQEISNKTALVRTNYDVPIKNGKVVDATRIEDSLDTIRFLIDQNCSIILISHQDRPEGKYHADNSLKPISDTLASLLNTSINFIPYPDLSPTKLPPKSITLLDNLRFYPQEKYLDQNWAKNFSELGDFYVNECFATSHRDHSSITLLPQLLPGYLGISFAQELTVLDQVLQNPQKPLIIVLGGAKIETKEPLIDVFKYKADQILVGGKIALDLTKHLTNLPSNVLVADLTPNAKDITKESAQKFAQIIQTAGTVIFNGTMGVFEEPPNDTGTRIVAKAVNQTSAYSLVGGGDTETALTQFDAEDNISHISSGGGAMLTYLSTKALIGLNAIKS